MIWRVEKWQINNCLKENRNFDLYKDTLSAIFSFLAVRGCSPVISKTLEISAS
jgi:hypothetical protein